VPDRISLNLHPRSSFRKKNKALRRSGLTPVHLYGPGIEPKSLQITSADLIKALAQAGATTPVSITVDGESGEHLAFAREVQWDPVRGDLVHVDFLRTVATELISAEAPVVLEGESAGARASFGSVVQLLRQVTVEALPLDMPREILVDVGVLDQPDSVLRAGNLSIPRGVTLLTDREEMVARVEAGRTTFEAAAGPQEEAQPAEGASPEEEST
jgi:large subunit ribosomal protein L25